MPQKPETIVITNFGGRLTRILNGDLNSGFAKFNTSFGYDPFTKPMNLTWLETPSSITGIQDVIMGGITRASNSPSSLLSAFLVGDTGKIYKVEIRNPQLGTSQGPFSPTSVFQLSGSPLPGASWSDMTNVYSLDGVTTTSTVPGSFPRTKFLCVNSYGFNLPLDATVRGITAVIYRRKAAGESTMSDFSVNLSKIAGQLTGDNKAYAGWSSSSIVGVPYGGSNDLWGTTWTPAEINASGFGLGVRASANTDTTALVDYISLQVSYLSSSTDSVIGISSVATTFKYGAGISFFGVNEKLYLGSDDRILVTGSVVGGNEFSLNGESTTIAQASVVGKAHPLTKFAGKLIFGNGPSIGAINELGIVVSSVFTVTKVFGNQYSQLSPPLPSNQQVRDLDPSPDANYLNISATSIPPEELTLPGADAQVSVPGEGGIYGWNGVDQGVTKFTSVPSGISTALQVYLQNNLIFLNDAFGTSVSDGVNKLLTIPFNKSPVPNATTINGNFLSWMAPEVTGEGSRPASLYYFGSLDEENPKGLYRLLRHFPYEQDLENSFTYQVPFNSLVTNKYTTTNTSVTGLQAVSYGKHFFSAYNISSTLSATTANGTHVLYSFLVTPTGFGFPLNGVYETQTQLFSKRVQLTQIRVYTEPTIAGNAFDLDIIGVDGDTITGGDFTYSFEEGTDITHLQGSLQRVNFNPQIDAGYGFGIRITNTGGTNMTIKKIEIDWVPQGK